MAATQLSTSQRASARPSWATDGGVVALGPALVRFTAKGDGDMADRSGSDPVVQARRRAVVDRPWTWLTQVHGADVVVVAGPGDGAGEPADAAVSVRSDVALAIVTADCAPVAFASPEGVVGVAHAGWRGLVAGVLEATVTAMRGAGARTIVAALGPCIHAECYPFGPSDLDMVAERLGAEVRGRSAAGQPALDIPRAVRLVLRRVDVDVVVDAAVCTACSVDHWSWRARQERGRQASVVWLP